MPETRQHTYIRKMNYCTRIKSDNIKASINLYVRDIYILSQKSKIAKLITKKINYKKKLNYRNIQRGVEVGRNMRFTK